MSQVAHIAWSSRAFAGVLEVPCFAVVVRASSQSEPLSSEQRSETHREGRGPVALDTASVFRRYAPYVAKIGMRILGRRDEIDDYVQDVFVAVHSHLSSLREPAALKGWVGKLAVHEATRRLRRRRLRALLGFGGQHDYTDVADGAASPDQRALLSHVFAALDALPAAERVAWSLRHIEGETMERVAVLCDCSLSTAKRRVASAETVLARLGVGHG